jgi:hypothetical protein
MTHASHIPKVMLPGAVWLTETVSFPHTLHSVVIFVPFRFDLSGIIYAPKAQIYLSRNALTRQAPHNLDTGIVTLA